MKRPGERKMARQVKADSREDCNFLMLRSGQHLPHAGTRAAETASRSTQLVDAVVEMPRRFESELGFRMDRAS